MLLQKLVKHPLFRPPRTMLVSCRLLPSVYLPFQLLNFSLVEIVKLLQSLHQLCTLHLLEFKLLAFLVVLAPLKLSKFLVQLFQLMF